MATKINKQYMQHYYASNKTYGGTYGARPWGLSRGGKRPSLLKLFSIFDSEPMSERQRAKLEKEERMRDLARAYRDSKKSNLEKKVDATLDGELDNNLGLAVLMGFGGFIYFLLNLQLSNMIFSFGFMVFALVYSSCTYNSKKQELLNNESLIESHSKYSSSLALIAMFVAFIFFVGV
jgi:hypothetical protein